MPKIKRRQYDDAFKREAVELILSGDRSASEVARSLDLNANVLRRWKKQYQNNELSVEARAKQDETSALRRELSRSLDLDLGPKADVESEERLLLALTLASVTDELVVCSQGLDERQRPRNPSHHADELRRVLGGGDPQLVPLIE